MNTTIEELAKEFYVIDMDGLTVNTKLQMLNFFAKAYHAQALLSQGEIIAWRLTHFDGSYEIVINESWQKVKRSEPLYLAPPATLQSEQTVSKTEIVDPVAFRYKHENDLQWQHTNKIEVISAENIIVENLYAAPPSIEALQKANAELFGKVEQLNKDKAELIAYVRKLLIELDGIYGLHKCTEEMRLIKYAQTLDHPQPKCMENK